MTSQASTSAGGIPAFWERLPSCFLSPLRPAHLMLYGVLSLLAAGTGFVLSTGDQVFGALTAVGMGLFAIHTIGTSTFRVMEAGARGIFDPDLTGAEAGDGGLQWLSWKMFVVAMVVGFVAGLFGAFAPWLAVAVQLLTMVAWPAQLVLLVRDQSIVSAANPLRWLEVARAMGKAYLVLALFLWFMSLGTGAMAALLLPRATPLLWLPLFVLVVAYFSHAMAYLLGYAAFQYHEALGIDPDARADLGRPKEDGPAQHIGALVAAGELGAAVDRAYEDQRLNPDSPAAHDRYHRVLMLAGDAERALNHGRRHLALLIGKGMTGEALKLLVELRDLDPEFRPDDPAHELPLAEAALRRQQPDLALGLLRGFDKRHRGHPQVAAVYLFTARLLATQYRDERTAVAILRTLLNRHADAEAAVEARILLDSLAPGGMAPTGQG